MSTHFPNKFGEQLKDCRKMAKTTQEELAAYIDKDPSLISHYERGEILPDRGRLYDLIRFFREKNVPNDSLERLFELSGYSIAQDFNAPVINQIVNILDILEQEPLSKTLFEGSLLAIVDDWKKYCDALRDLKRSYIQDAQEGFSLLLSLTGQELPLRQRLNIHVYQGLANAWRYLGEPLRGLEFLNRAIKIAEELGELEKETLAKLLLDRGNFYRRLNEWEKAKTDYGNSRQLFKRLNGVASERKDQFIAVIERKLAGTLLFQGQPQKALEHCSHSINICRDLSDRVQECKGLQHQAWALAMLGHWDEALEIHKEVINTFKVLGVSTILMSKSYLYLADIYQMCGVLEKAETTYDIALSYLQNHLKQKGEFEGDYIIYGTILIGKGSIFRTNNAKLDQAKVLLDKGLKSQLQLKARHHEALTRSELGRLAIATNDFTQAKYELEKAKEIFFDLDNMYYFVEQFVNLAELEYRRNNFPEARTFVTRAIEYSEKQGFNVHLVRATLRLAEINLASQDNIDPLELYVSALQKARELNPYIIHEVLSRIVGQPHALYDEANIRDKNLQLCQVILNDRENLFKGLAFSTSSLQNWLDEINYLQAKLEQ